MSLPPVYAATINTPGYMPMADEPAAFDTAREAWAYLLSEREREEEQAATGTEPYSDTYRELERLSQGGIVLDMRRIVGDWSNASDDPVGVVYGPTPGYDGEHDLSIAYHVSRIDHADYPHHAGRLVDCAACQSRCHCEPDTAECVYGGEHS